MNRKGAIGEHISVFAFLLLLILVGVGIVGGVYIFYQSGYDARMADASLLGARARECIEEKGIETLDNFFEKCRLNKEKMEGINIIKICVDSKDCVSDNTGFFFGSNFESCFLAGGEGNKGYSRCYLERFEIGGKRVDIIAGSKRVSRRVLG